MLIYWQSDFLLHAIASARHPLGYQSAIGKPIKAGLANDIETNSY
jgi:hypothetical protein